MNFRVLKIITLKKEYNLPRIGFQKRELNLFFSNLKFYNFHESD